MFYPKENDTTPLNEYKKRAIGLYSDLEKCVSYEYPEYINCSEYLKKKVKEIDNEGHREKYISQDETYSTLFQTYDNMYRKLYQDGQAKAFAKFQESKSKSKSKQSEETEALLYKKFEDAKDLHTYNETTKSEQQLSNQVDDLLKKLNLDQKTFLNERMQKTFQENTELRDSLESKLQDLYGERNIRLMDSNSTMNASTYANLMWTIIATTSLYIIIVYR